jgi:hypothetical protein
MIEIPVAIRVGNVGWRRPLSIGAAQIASNIEGIVIEFVNGV